jgi:hypothetical protein
MNIEARYNGRILSVGAALGQCGPNTCSPHAVGFVQSAGDSKTWSAQKDFVISTDKFGATKPGHVSVLPYGDAIIAKCNQHLAADGPTQSHSFNHTFDATFLAHTRKHQANDTGSNGAPTAGSLVVSAQHSMTDSFSVPVVCDPVVKSSTDDVATEKPATLSVGSIELFRSTFVHETSQPNPATECKKARWLVRLNTNKAGPVKFKLWTKVGDAPMTSKVIDAWSSFDGNSKYKAEYVEWTEVTKTTFVQAKAEDMTNAIGQSTDWKDITLQCDGVAGGLADVPNTNNPDDGVNPVTLKVTGELTLADKDGAPKDKPRLGAAVFKIWATKPGSTSYKLTCSGGRNWEGTLPTFKVADKKYQAVGLQNFQIDKTEQIGCALRSTSLPNDPVIAVATKLFELIKRNPDIGGADTEANGPRPTHDKADTGRPATLVDQARPQKPDVQKPDVKVAPVNKVSCGGGKISGDTCFCPAGTEKVQAAPNAFRCIKQVARPERLAPPTVKHVRPAFIQRQTFQPVQRQPVQRQTSVAPRPMRLMR